MQKKYIFGKLVLEGEDEVSSNRIENTSIVVSVSVNCYFFYTKWYLRNENVLSYF